MLNYFNWIFSFDYDEPKGVDIPNIVGIPTERTLNPFYYDQRVFLVVESRYRECDLNEPFIPGKSKSDEICTSLKKICTLQGIEKDCGDCK